MLYDVTSGRGHRLVFAGGDYNDGSIGGRWTRNSFWKRGEGKTIIVRTVLQKLNYHRRRQVIWRRDVHTTRH